MSKKRLTREESKRLTRERLLHVATEMFAEQGFYSTSVDQIAEKAGYSKGAVYSNFGSKDDLFLTIFKENQQDDLQQLSEFARQFDSIDDFIQTMEAHHKYDRTEQAAWSILKLEFLLYAMRNDNVRKKLAVILRENRQEMAEILMMFFSKDEKVMSETIDELAFLLLSLDIGIGIQAFVDNDNIPEQIFAKGLRRLMM